MLAMANFLPSEEPSNSYGDETIDYFDTILQTGLPAPSDIQTSSQATFSGLSQTILSSVSQMEDTSQLRSLAPASAQSPLISGNSNILGEFSASYPELGSNNLVRNAQGINIQYEIQANEKLSLLHGEKFDMDTDAADFSRNQKSSEPDAVILEELNKIFGYTENSSPEVTSSNDGK